MDRHNRESEYDRFLHRHGRPVARGTDELGLTLTETEKALRLVASSGLVVLGGDTYLRVGDKIESAYTPWSIELRIGESEDDLVSRSVEESLQFLRRLRPLPEGQEYLAVIVTGEPQWAIARAYSL